MARTELQLLMNEPVTVMIGSKAKPLRVTIYEPTMQQLGEYTAMLGAALGSLYGADQSLMSKAAALPIALSTLMVKVIEDGTTEAARKKVGAEDVPAYVERMSPKQQAGIIKALADQLGWEFIKETFSQAKRNLTETIQKNGSNAAPSWSREPSAKSAARSRN